MSSYFLFVVCQVGSEATVKNEVARKHPSFRFSFSRRGFLTFRIPDEVARDRKFELNCAFARTWGFSLGKAVGTDGQQLARDFWMPFVERYPAEVLAQFQHLHVWQRDRFVPGDSDFEPGITPLAEGIETPGEALACADLGFALGQGYLCGMPTSARDLLAKRVQADFGIQTSMSRQQPSDSRVPELISG